MKKNIKIIATILYLFAIIDSYSISPIDTNKFVLDKRIYIEKTIKKNNIKGLSIALFTKDKIIWKECFGESTYHQKINDSTIFSIQSISKNFTALAIMFAVQDSLIDLDVPITKYLPDFKVNSCFENSPESKITLRSILNHTAGFAHEAPIGGNFDVGCYSNQDHWNSISDTWLLFPVGTKYSYSNLGIDLAAKIIERVSGISFENYMKNKIFQPLGMKYSTVDDNEVRLNNNRTEGYINFAKHKHYKNALIGSGAVYSNINEMIKYAQFQMNLGLIDSKQIVETKYLLEMYKINKSNYGLGTYVGHLVNKEKSFDTYYINHNGGGFGFGSTMTWFPEYNIGCIILGNKPYNYGSISYNFLHDFLVENVNPTKDKDLTVSFFPEFETNNTEKSKQEHVYINELKPDSLGQINIVGKYEIVFTGYEFIGIAKLFKFMSGKTKMSIQKKHDLFVMKGCFGQSKLKEYRNGLFFNDKGEVFDFRGESPTFMNVKLKQISKK